MLEQNAGRLYRDYFVGHERRLGTSTWTSYALTSHHSEGMRERFQTCVGESAAEKLKEEARTELRDEPEETRESVANIAYQYSARDLGRFLNLPGTSTSDAVRTAVREHGILDFLKQIAEGRCEDVTLEQFRGGASEANSWENNKQYLKGRFLASGPGNHEWIPRSLIMAVVERAANSANEALQGVKWIDLQFQLTSPTNLIIFSPHRQAAQAIIEEMGEEARQLGERMLEWARHIESVIRGIPDRVARGEEIVASEFRFQGHVGALSRRCENGRSGSQHDGQNFWHQALRNCFVTARSMGEVIGNIRRFAELCVWDGELPETYADAQVQEASEGDREGQPTVSIEGVLSQIRWDYAIRRLEEPDLSGVSEEDRNRIGVNYATMMGRIAAAREMAEGQTIEINNLQEYSSMQKINRDVIISTIDTVARMFSGR